MFQVAGTSGRFGKPSSWLTSLSVPLNLPLSLCLFLFPRRRHHSCHFGITMRRRLVPGHDPKRSSVAIKSNPRCQSSGFQPLPSGVGLCCVYLGMWWGSLLRRVQKKAPDAVPTAAQVAGLSFGSEHFACISEAERQILLLRRLGTARPLAPTRCRCSWQWRHCCAP